MLPAKTLTLAVLCMLPLRWPHRTWSQVSKDFLAFPLCLCLHLTGMPPILPLSAAIAYVVWVSLPGSFSSLTLPRHSEFMRTLVFPPGEEPDECNVCWDNENRLAQLPCWHRCCEGCLRLMGQLSQTACPTCRAPLFSKRDRIMFVMSKGSVAVAVVNIAVYSLRLLLNLQAGNFLNAGICFGSMCPMAWYLRAMIGFCRERGESWWRDAAAATKEPASFELKMASFAFGTGVFLFFQTVWITRGSLCA